MLIDNRVKILKPGHDRPFHRKQQQACRQVRVLIGVLTSRVVSYPTVEDTKAMDAITKHLSQALKKLDTVYPRVGG